MNIVAVIPARMGSSRFPGKPLAPILGMPMIEHVYRRTRMVKELDAVYIATCDQEIAEAATAFGARAIMTSDEHQRASDRVAEATNHFEADIVVMVQGDEPMITPEMVSASIPPFLEDSTVVCTNLTTPIKTAQEFKDRNTIKIVMDQRKNALYFSREPIPTESLLDMAQIPVYKQVCIIAFTRDGLQEFTRLSPTPLEQAESIDMLRFVEHGVPVRLVHKECDTHAVDTPADLALVEELMRSDPLVASYVGGVVPEATP